MTEVILSMYDQHLALIMLNRPHALNALNRCLLETLKEHLKTLASDIHVRVVIFTGTGDKAFSAGADLKERQGMSLAETQEFVKLIGETFTQVANLPMATIAAINGAAFGGGLELALACDMRVMDEAAQIGLTECALGIIPGAGGTQRLPRIVGEAKAKELIFAAKRIDAHEAKAIGLVNQVSTNNHRQSVLKIALELAQQIAKCAPLSVRAAKKAITNGAALALDEGLALEAECYEEILHSRDRLEGLEAFAQKRVPYYLGQ